MKCFIVAALMISAIPAFAADKYQVIPFYSLYLSPNSRYVAMILDTTNGESFSCSADVRQGNAPRTQVYCKKANVAKGSMPSGPAEPSPNRPNNSDFLGIWKIDQTSGNVTFCGVVNSGPPGPYSWYCATQPPP
jgi:hypothetical protein